MCQTTLPYRCRLNSTIGVRFTVFYGRRHRTVVGAVIKNRLNTSRLLDCREIDKFVFDALEISVNIQTKNEPAGRKYGAFQ